MAEPRQSRGSFQIQVSYSFDRLLETKLAQAYEILVPCRERPVGVRVKEFEDENGRDLRPGTVSTYSVLGLSFVSTAMAAVQSGPAPADGVFDPFGGTTLRRSLAVRKERRYRGVCRIGRALA